MIDVPPYIKPTDPDAFVDWPRQSPTEWASIECPQCKGHGGWNLSLNQYPLHDKEDTPEARHLFSHFRSNCGQCNGYGFVREEDSGHIHDWDRVQNAGNCLNLYACSVCGKKWEVDSSD